jgi:segregation and condensation protein A
MTLILDILRLNGKTLFESLFAEIKTRMEVIVTFLAMLELVKVRAIKIVQEEMSGPIQIESAGGWDQAAALVAIHDIEEEHGT